MSGEEKNKSFYKETFEEITVPEGLAEKVGRGVEREDRRQRTGTRSVMRKVAFAAAVLAALFAGSNGIAYAMTGETWVKTIILRRNVDGIEYEIEAEERELRNGETVYYGDYTTPDGKKHYAVDHEGGGMYMEVMSTGAEVWMKDGRTYIWDGDVEIDITEDFEDDGFALGTYKVDEILKAYRFWKKDGNICCWMEILSEGESESNEFKRRSE